VGLLTTILLAKQSIPTLTAAKRAHVLPAQTSLADHYLDIMKRHLTRSDYDASDESSIPASVRRFLNARGL